jgi:hypothetical protein
MNYTRALVGVLAAVAMGAMALPSQAATSRTLNFDDKYTSDSVKNTCTPVWILTTAAPGDGNCADIQAGENGVSPFLADDKYASVAKAVGFKIDAKRKLTGTIYIGQHAPWITGTSADYLPGQIGADIAISMNGVALALISVTKPATSGILAIPVSLSIPSKLNKKVLKSLIADVKYTSGFGYMGVQYAAPNQSKLVVPSTK